MTKLRKAAVREAVEMPATVLPVQVSDEAMEPVEIETFSVAVLTTTITGDEE
jgi:hypothetical protein